MLVGDKGQQGIFVADAPTAELLRNPDLGAGGQVVGGWGSRQRLNQQLLKRLRNKTTASPLLHLYHKHVALTTLTVKRVSDSDIL